MPTVFIFDHVTQKSVDQSARKLEQDVQASIADLAYEVEGDITSVQTSITNLTNEVESDITDVQASITSITNLTNEIESDIIDVQASITNLTNEVESDITSVQEEIQTCIKRTVGLQGGLLANVIELNDEVNDSVYSEFRHKDISFTRLIKESNQNPKIANLVDFQNNGNTSVKTVTTTLTNFSVARESTTNIFKIGLDNNDYTELSYNSTPLLRLESTFPLVSAIGNNGFATNILRPHTGSIISVQGVLATDLLQANTDSKITIQNDVKINGTLSHNNTVLTSTGNVYISDAYNIYISQNETSSDYLLYSLPVSGNMYNNLRGKTITIKRGNSGNVQIHAATILSNNIYPIDGTNQKIELTSRNASVVLFCSSAIDDFNWYILSSHGVITLSNN